MSKCCANCFWCFTPEDEEYLEGYSEDAPNRPKAGDCCIGQEHDNNYYCSSHSYIEGMEEYETYVLYDDKYLGPGYLIVSKLDDEIVRFMKISSVGEGGFPCFSIRAYEKGSIDKPDEEFREIRFDVNSDEPLYNILSDFAFSLGGRIIRSNDSLSQGNNHLYAEVGTDIAYLLVVKDVYGVKHSTDFVDISVGDNDSCECYPEIMNFYNNLSTIAVGKTNDECIKRLLLEM